MIRNNNLYVKNCKDCGLIFRTDKPKVQLCSSCRQGHRRKTILSERKTRKKPKSAASNLTGLPALSMNEMLCVIRSYNKEHNTNYTYGRFVDATRQGKIKIEL